MKKLLIICLTLFFSIIPIYAKEPENILKTLTFSSGQLAESFDPHKYSYNMYLDEQTTSLQVSATADPTFTIQGLGVYPLKKGLNTIKITVSSPGVQTKNYQVHVYVKNKPKVYLDYQNTQYGFIDSFVGMEIPRSFSLSSLTIQGQPVLTLYNKALDMTIAYMMSNTNGSFFIIKDNQIVAPFQSIVLDNHTYIVANIPSSLQNRMGMNYQNITIEGYNLNGWTYKENKADNYVQVYLYDQDDEPHIYQYEKQNKQIQLYLQQSSVSPTEVFYLAVIIVLFVLLVGLFVSQIHFKKVKIQQIKDYYQSRNNRDKQ